MGTYAYIFILMWILTNIFMFYWILLRKINTLHSDVREFDLQLKSIIESLEKKMCEQELDVSSIKDDFKQIQTKIIEGERNMNMFPI